jgi:hypothetical protein
MEECSPVWHQGKNRRSIDLMFGYVEQPSWRREQGEFIHHFGDASDLGDSGARPVGLPLWDEPASAALAPFNVHQYSLTGDSPL